MELKPKDQAESAFRRVESTLDSALGVLRAESPGFEVVEHSNRSGSDKSGYSFYLWHIILQSDTPPCPYVERHGVDIRYQEPLEVGADRMIELAAFAEKFHTGQESFFKKTEKHNIPASEATPGKICTVVRRCMQSAAEMIGGEQSPPAYPGGRAGASSGSAEA